MVSGKISGFGDKRQRCHQLTKEICTVTITSSSCRLEQAFFVSHIVAHNRILVVTGLYTKDTYISSCLLFRLNNSKLIMAIRGHTYVLLVAHEIGLLRSRSPTRVPNTERQCNYHTGGRGTGYTCASVSREEARSLSLVINS